MPTSPDIDRTKLDLIDWINQLSDINVLSFLEALRKSRSKKDWWDGLSKVQQDNIFKGLEDAENGRTLTSNEFWQELRNGRE